MSKGKIILVIVLAVAFVFGVRSCTSNHDDKAEESNKEEVNEIENSVEDTEVQKDNDETDSDFDMEEIAVRNTNKVDGDIDRTAEENAIQQYGTDVVNQVKENAKKAVELWIMENPDESQWKSITTKDFYENNVQDLGMYDDGTVTRKITKLEPVISEHEESDHLRVSFNTEMDIVVNNQVINHQTLLYSVDFVNDGEKWIIDNVNEETNYLGNE